MCDWQRPYVMHGAFAQSGAPGTQGRLFADRHAVGQHAIAPSGFEGKRAAGVSNPDHDASPPLGSIVREDRLKFVFDMGR